MFGDGFGPESGEVFKKGSYVTTLLLIHYIAEQFLQVGNICILESNFVVQEINELKIVLEKYNAECLLYVFKGDLDVMFDRYVERERHWVHKLVSDRDGFKNVMAERFGLENAETEQKITVDTTSFENVDYENLFAAAKRFIENN
jgi:hypothetical protein